jgi:anti-anti-sigma factor
MPVEKWSDRVMIVRLAAEPQFSDDLQLLEDQLATRPLDAVLDFAAIRFVNSSSIARLISLRKAISAAGGRLVMCGADTQVWSAFLVTGLDKVFEFSDNVPTALATLQIADRTS